MKDTQKPTQRARAEHALRHAERAVGRGDLAAVTRWTKAAELFARAAERVAALPEPVVQDVEAIRAELRERIARHIAAHKPIADWERACEIHAALVAFAEERGVAPPPPASPPPDMWAFEMPEGARLGSYVPPPRLWPGEDEEEPSPVREAALRALVERESEEPPPIEGRGQGAG